MLFSLWRWFVLITPVSSQIGVTGQSVLDLKGPFLGGTAQPVRPHVEVPHTLSQEVVMLQVLVPDLHQQTQVCVHLIKNIYDIIFYYPLHVDFSQKQAQWT